MLVFYILRGKGENVLMLFSTFRPVKYVHQSQNIEKLKRGREKILFSTLFYTKKFDS